MMMARGTGGMIKMSDVITSGVELANDIYGFGDDFGFSERLRGYAVEIYKRELEAIGAVDLQTIGKGKSVLDEKFGIDTILKLKGGQTITLQEKYRRNSALNYGDFTQEFMNGGKEQDGEWFHLGAQIYFYGWAREDEKGFERWFMMDILKYKLLIQEAGGIDKIGTLHSNYTHGKASFYSIPLGALRPAIIRESNRHHSNGSEKPNAWKKISLTKMAGGVLHKQMDLSTTRWGEVV